eukprot:scaffold88403_cov55-Attheya_sp.AAC.6
MPDMPRIYEEDLHCHGMSASVLRGMYSEMPSRGKERVSQLSCPHSVQAKSSVSAISLHLIDTPPVILRNRRPDYGFDKLIENIYGDITALEKQEEQEIEKLNRDKHMNNAYAESRMRGILNQAIQRRKPKTVAGVKRKASLAASSSAANEDGNFPNLKESTLVQYVLRRHPREALVDRLDRECLKTSKNVSVGVVKLFLSRKLSYEPSSHFQITIEAGGKEILLDNSITIEEILRDLSDEGVSPLVLNYGIGKSVNVMF